MGEVDVISAWDIYWVMQLDSIGGFLRLVMVAGLSIGAVALMGGAIITECGTDKHGMKDAPAVWGACKTWAWRMLTIGAIVGALNAFIPSTKTAAAMIVLPRIANNEAIQREAGDLYGIAKDALRNLATPKQEPRK